MSTVYSFESNEHFHEFITQLVASGQYENASDVFREGLRLLEVQNERRKEKLALLKALAEEGFRQLDQGQGIELNSRKELRKFLRSIRRDADAKVGDKQS